MPNQFTEAEDLIVDQSFIGWYNKSNPQDVTRWENWILENPDKLEIIRQATQLLNTLKFEKKEISEEQISTALGSTLKRYESGKVVRMNSGRIRYWIGAAAAVALIVAGAYFLSPVFISKAIRKTEYGQVRLEKLPDGTEVTLNARSSIQYAKNWKQDAEREVWLNGEAFFHVSKTEKKNRFVVHTTKFDIVVTGTQFNAVNKEGRANVLLKEGGVTIITKSGEEIKLTPGEYYEFTEQYTGKKAINDEAVLAWTAKKIDFNNTPLPQAIDLIREHYGVNVKIATENLKSQTLTGMMPNDNLEVLLDAIEVSLDCKVTHQNNEIILSSEH